MDSSMISVIYDEQGKSIVVINDILFVGKRSIDWEEVKKYLTRYIHEKYEIIESADVIYVGSDFPDEFKGSNDTKRLRGTNAKAKANAASGLPYMIQFATNKRWQENYKEKHGVDAAYGWYRFTTRFALPIYSDNGELVRYNVYRIEMLIRHASDGKMYLYDLVNVKKEKETSTPPRH